MQFPRQSIADIAHRRRDHRLWWGAAGGTLLGIFCGLAVLSRQFEYGGNYLQRPLPLLVVMLVAAGLVYLGTVFLAQRTLESRSLLIWIGLVGFFCRLVMLPSDPIQEVDFYRYLWDGGVLAHGINPYSYSPVEIMAGITREGTPIPAELLQLAANCSFAEDEALVITRINYAMLSTIYPPVAQGFFALCHWLKPWSLNAWRLLLLVVDLLVLWQLICFLARLKIPAVFLVIYWWNPVLIKEIYNSGHMDILILPFLLGAFIWVQDNKTCGAALLLALASGCKIWPLLLVPLFLRQISDPGGRRCFLAVFSIMFGILAVPICFAGLGFDSGFVRFGTSWETNAAFFKLIDWPVAWLIEQKLSFPDAGLMARLIVFVLLVTWIFVLVRSPVKGVLDFWEKALFTTAAVFLLSPTQYPWYFVWFLPFLILFPKSPLLWLTVLLPLYYLRFFFSYRGSPEVFESVIVWLEFVPVWLLLFFEWRRKQAMDKPTVKRRSV